MYKNSEVLDDYFETEEFNRGFRIISKYKLIDQEKLAYGIQKIKDLPPETFTKICNAVYSSLEKKVVEEQNFPFGKYHVDYRGIRFNLMIGQGSSYWTEKL